VLEHAISVLRSGGVVAFPTETVYGLGADATNAAAVRKIFEFKGRPSTNPVIVHVADASVAKRYAREWPAAAQKLAEAFWPGALTIVLPKNPVIVDEATAGLDTVGLRAPDHQLTLELLRDFDGPLAGPSANKSSHVSPTTAHHVRDEFGDALMVLDGGPCRVGIESTVLDLSRDRPTILRPGGVSRERIEEVIGSVEVKSVVTEVTAPVRAPGQHAVHYAPRTRAFRFDGKTVPPHNFARVATLWVSGDPQAYAHELYSVLREMDAAGYDAILIQMPPDEPAWAAVRDRLMRATQPLVKSK
jgi:L-threonylcarbamoyladenylate synthase